jgi:hypothetical protein
LSSSVGAKRTLREERVFQRQIQLAVKKPPERSTARERSQEDDNAVRNNLPAEIIPVFDKDRRSFKGSPRRRRTEQFLEWAEENPDEVLAEADRAIKDLLAQERALRREARSGSRHRGVTTKHLATYAIPFLRNLLNLGLSLAVGLPVRYS